MKVWFGKPRYSCLCRVGKLRIGMRVKTVFEENRTGSLLDVKHFVPLGK